MEFSGLTHVVFLGGNGFIGAETTKMLLKVGCKITTISRGGSWNDWDYNNILPKVTWIKHNRKNPLSQCKQLENHIKELKGTPFKALVDFSGYKKSHVMDSLDFFRDKIDFYIYISSDSVYEVCRVKSHNEPTKEEDAIRPLSKKEQKKLKEMESYGHNKLCCEEALVKQSICENGIPFIILRLADVIGERDCTDRWWTYQTWIKLSGLSKRQELPVCLPNELKNTNMSFVYVKDVAQLITQLVQKDNHSLSLIKNQAYNLALNETVKLHELLELIQKELSVKDTVYQFSDSKDVPHIYPSVDRGPVEVSRAKHILGWTPTPWQNVIKNIVQFYENALTDPEFSSERTDIYKTLVKDLSDIIPIETNIEMLKRLLNL